MVVRRPWLSTVLASLASQADVGHVFTPPQALSGFRLWQLFSCTSSLGLGISFWPDMAGWPRLRAACMSHAHAGAVVMVRAGCKRRAVLQRPAMCRRACARALTLVMAAADRGNRYGLQTRRSRRQR